MSPCRSLSPSAVLLLAAVVLTGCQKESPVPQQKDSPMPTNTRSLDELLTAADPAAVDIAARQGAAAIPAIQRAAASAKPGVREVAMNCAAVVPGADSAALLAQGIADANLNVALAAANALSSNPPPQTAPAILTRLTVESDDRIRDALALAAGYLPGDRTVLVLRPIAAGTDFVARTARMALAKLGDAAGRAALKADLASPTPRVRYDAVGWLRYINDPALAPEAKKLLTDREPAVNVGSVRQREFRRPCDQAVDTLIFLQKIKPPFPNSVEKIYSDAELASFARLVK